MADFSFQILVHMLHNSTCMTANDKKPNKFLNNSNKGNAKLDDCFQQRFTDKRYDSPKLILKH